MDVAPQTDIDSYCFSRIATHPTHHACPTGVVTSDCKCWMWTVVPHATHGWQFRKETTPVARVHHPSSVNNITVVWQPAAHYSVVPEILSTLYKPSFALMGGYHRSVKGAAICNGAPPVRVDTCTLTIRYSVQLLV